MKREYWAAIIGFVAFPVLYFGLAAVSGAFMGARSAVQHAA